jgi:two-component system chemotaxis response regulator CheY
MRILIVDDDPLSRRLLNVSLAWGKHEVLEAEDGQIAWDLWQHDPVRLIITDWMMPNIDGPELIRRIRAAQTSGYTYIILLTARGTKTEIVTGLRSGADDYLTKPFHTEELLARVNIGERILNLEESLNSSNQKMQFLATHDGLTDLLNRRAIQEHAEAEINRAYREHTAVSLALLDVDHFKSINDRYGHLTGDQALLHVAQLLREKTRPYDWVGRWGGEEFLIVLPNATLVDAGVVAERIRVAIEQTPLALAGNGQLSLRASLGCACLMNQSEGEAPPLSLDELVHKADEALYRAKETGRNRVCLAE